MAQGSSPIRKRVTIFHGSGAFALTREIFAFLCRWSKPISVWGLLRCHSRNARTATTSFCRTPGFASGIKRPPQSGHEFGVTNEMDQESQHVRISRTEGEAPEIVRGAEREPGLDQWRRLAALYDPLAAGRSLDDSRQILSPPKAAQIDDLCAHHPSPGKLGTTPSRTHWRPVARRHATGYSSHCVPHRPGKRVDSAATFVPGFCTNEGSHCDRCQQPYPRSCSNDDGKFE